MNLIYHVQYLNSHYVTIASNKAEAHQRAVDHFRYINGTDVELPEFQIDRQRYSDEVLVLVN